MDITIIVALISGSIALIVSKSSNYSQENRILKDHINNRKRELYQRYIDMFVDLCLKKSDFSEEEYNFKLKSEMGLFRKDLMLYAGIKVINSFNDFQLKGATFIQFDKILYEMRKELGINDGYFNSTNPTYSRVQVLVVDDISKSIEKEKISIDQNADSESVIDGRKNQARNPRQIPKINLN